MRWQLRYMAWLFAIVVAVCAIYGGFLWASYIDRTYTSGEAYGLVIGESKQATFAKLPAALREEAGTLDSIFIELKVDSSAAAQLGVAPGRHVKLQTFLEPALLGVLSDKDAWDFYLAGNYHNAVRLKFCDGKLCQIHRHRKYFEIP